MTVLAGSAGHCMSDSWDCGSTRIRTVATHTIQSGLVSGGQVRVCLQLQSLKECFQIF